MSIPDTRLGADYSAAAEDAALAMSQPPAGEPDPGDDAEAMSLQDVTGVLEIAYRKLQQARDGYEHADEYFQGKSPEVFSDPQIRRLLGLGESYAINYAAIPVRVVANRMNLDTVEVAGNDAANAAIKDLWAQNRLSLEEHGFTVDALKYGDNYMIVWPREDGTVQMQPNSPMTTRIFYDPEDDRTKAYALKAWEADAKTVRADLYYPNWVYKLISKNGGKRWDMLPEDDGSWPMENPYGEVPVFHWRAGDTVPYGQPEHADAFGPQDGLVKSANTMFGTIDFLGFPQRYALVEAASASGTAEFSDFDDAQPDAFIVDDDGRTSGLRQGPGELWTLRAQSVGQFTPADPQGFIKVWDQCIGAMSAATFTPMRFFTPPAGQHPSGDSLRAMDFALMQKIKTRSLSFGASWSDGIAFALRLMKIKVTADQVTVRWLPLGQDSDLDTVAGAPLAVWKLRLGVPRRVVFKALGYTDQEIDAWQLGPEADLGTEAQLWPKSPPPPPIPGDGVAPAPAPAPASKPAAPAPVPALATPAPAAPAKPSKP